MHWYPASSSSVNHFERSSLKVLANQSKSESPWEGEEKVNFNGQCHMTKMATTPLYGKKE